MDSECTILHQILKMKTAPTDRKITCFCSGATGHGVMLIRMQVGRRKQGHVIKLLR